MCACVLVRVCACVHAFVFLYNNSNNNNNNNMNDIDRQYLLLKDKANRVPLEDFNILTCFNIDSWVVMMMMMMHCFSVAHRRTGRWKSALEGNSSTSGLHGGQCSRRRASICRIHSIPGTLHCKWDVTQWLCCLIHIKKLHHIQNILYVHIHISHPN